MGTEIKAAAIAAAAIAAALERSPGERSSMRSATAGTPPESPKTQDENEVTRSRRFATSYLFVPGP